MCGITTAVWEAEHLLAVSLSPEPEAGEEEPLSPEEAQREPLAL